jgi:hypothetical protein
VFHYRVFRGVVFADHSHAENGLLRGYRDSFLEMLLTSIWLYKEFPDVDLWVSFSDEPSRCDLDIPILQYTIINVNVTRAAAKSSVGYIDGVPFSIVKLLTGGGDEPGPNEPAPKFHRGWGMSWPEVWEKVALLPSSLKAYHSCIKERSGGTSSIAKLVWRGSNTGGGRGWPPVDGPAAALLSSGNPLTSALFNKRMAVSALGRYHADLMDVGLHTVAPELLPEGMLLKEMKCMSVKARVSSMLHKCFCTKLLRNSKYLKMFQAGFTKTILQELTLC